MESLSLVPMNTNCRRFRYERNGSSTFLVIVVTETLNITCAFINAAIWLLGKSINNLFVE